MAEAAKVAANLKTASRDAGKDSARAALEKRIGRKFKKPALLREALTHASAANGAASNQRLEFLGDRVLGLIVAEKLYAAFPNEAEDGLAPRLNALVNRAACARAARRAELGAALIMAPSETQQGGREKDAILADACEAIIAALFLDGGFAAAQKFVERFWVGEFEAVTEAPRDPKTALQEWAASRKQALSYEVVSRTGPEHAPVFIVEARIDGLAPSRGEGGSKREAERAAAAALLANAGVHA